MAAKVREKDGEWYLFIDYKGRRKAKRYGPGAALGKLAKRDAEIINGKLASGDLSVFTAPEPVAATVGFRAHVEDWLQTHISPRRARGTHAIYRSQMDLRWLPAFKDTPLTHITRAAIIKALGTMLGQPHRKTGQPLSSETIRTALCALKSCLGYAVKTDLLPTNPALGLGEFARRSSDGKRRVAAYPAPVLGTILAAAEREVPRWYPAVLLMSLAGLRIGEVLTLQPEDLDFPERLIHVRRTWGGDTTAALGEKRIGPPKSGEGRAVDMAAGLVPVLQAWVDRRHVEEVVAGRTPTWLFPAPAKPGDACTPSYFREEVWRPLLRRLGLPHQKAHTLRHTYATLLIRGGHHNLAYIQQQLGHASIDITVDTYGHLVPGVGRHAVDALAGQILGPGSATIRNPRATSGRGVSAK